VPELDQRCCVVDVSERYQSRKTYLTGNDTQKADNVSLDTDLETFADVKDHLPHF
jgi:hypothetical protein